MDVKTGLAIPPDLLIGTSSWSSTDWFGSFYPEHTDSGEMIRVYSSRLPTVEIDSTWYHMPNQKLVEAWKSKTPDGFIFSAKVPKVISHDKYMEGCEAEINEFVAAMSGLEDKLGPMILQFPYVAKGKDAHEYETGEDFVRRLSAFVHLLPKEFKWGIEIRNARWVQPRLLDILQHHNISLVFIDYYTMDPLPKLAARNDVFTSSFIYVRFLGNRNEIESAVKKAREDGLRSNDWGSLLVDRSAQMQKWIPPIKQQLAKGIPVYVYFNNHYAGYAPGSVELFKKLFRGEPEEREGKEGLLPLRG
jgi:uncharacterized protein YecE (DUF72 family)